MYNCVSILNLIRVKMLFRELSQCIIKRNIKYGNDVIAILQNSYKIMDTLVVPSCVRDNDVGRETAYLRIAIRSCIRMHRATFEMQKRIWRCYANDATEKSRKTYPLRQRKEQCDFPEVRTISFEYYHILTKINNQDGW